MTRQPPADGLNPTELERQFEELAKQFRRLADLARDGRRRAGERAFLRELLPAVGVHFGVEESLMAACDFRNSTIICDSIWA